MTNLYPIAVSSQLDHTGRERIHAANKEPTDRVSYSPAPVVPVFWNPVQTWWYAGGTPFQLIPEQLSDENKTFTAYDDGVSDDTYSYTRAVQGRTVGTDTGLRYFEIVVTDYLNRNNFYGAIGDTAPAQIEPYNTKVILVDMVSFSSHVFGQNTSSNIPDLVIGDVLGFLINLVTGKVWVSINGAWQDVAPDNANGWNGITLPADTYRPFAQFYFDYFADNPNYAKATVRLYAEEFNNLPSGALPWSDGVLPP